MPIRVVCPSCHKAINAPDSAAGKQGKCPGCQTVITIPEAEATLEIIEESMPPSPAAYAPQAVPSAAAEGMKCSRTCANPVHETAVACTECGVPPKSGKAYCYHCGAGTRPEAVMCVKCGIAVQAPISIEAGKIMKDPISLFDHFLNCFKREKGFSGRARRREFWGFFLFTSLSLFILGIITVEAEVEDSSLGKISFLFGVILFMPYLMVFVRRLHDAGSHWIAAVPFAIFDIADLAMSLAVWRGWATSGQVDAPGWALLCISTLYIVIFAVGDSVPGTNKYGPNPKGA